MIQEGSSNFYSFRGIINFTHQLSLETLGLSNDSKTKNGIFIEFFELLKKQQRIESQYKKRQYYLIYKNKYEDIVHCQLARKRTNTKYDFIEVNNIAEKEEDDFPYINIFVELISQKFLIQSNTLIFEDYNTCGKVLENIINHKINPGMKLSLNPILGEENFWQYFDNKTEVYSLKFSLCTPNLFDAEDDAENFLKEAEKNVQANKLNMEFLNDKGQITPNKTGIDSYVKYANAGGGDWSIRIKDKTGKKQTITSKQKSAKIELDLSNHELKQPNLDNEKIIIIKRKFDSIETIEKFKETI